MGVFRFSKGLLCLVCAATAVSSHAHSADEKQLVRQLVEDLFRRSGAEKSGLLSYELRGVSTDDPSKTCVVKFTRTVMGQGFDVNLHVEGVELGKTPSFRLSDADVLRSFTQDAGGFDAKSTVKSLSPNRVEKLGRIAAKRFEKKVPGALRPVLGLIEIPKSVSSRTAAAVVDGVRATGADLKDVRYLKHAATYTERLGVHRNANDESLVDISQRRSPTLLSKISPIGLFLGFPHGSKANCTFALPESEVRRAPAVEPDTEITALSRDEIESASAETASH